MRIVKAHQNQERNVPETKKTRRGESPHRLRQFLQLVVT
jgi:hypothetical protein